MKGMVSVMEKTLEKLTSADGVVAASLVTDSCCETQIAPKHSGNKIPWDELFSSLVASFNLLKAHGHNDLRVIVGEYSVNLERFGDVVLCVATTIGHPIVKSLRRMMARTMKQTRPSKQDRNAITSSSQPAI